MGLWDKIKGFGKRVWEGAKGFGKKAVDTGKKVFKKVGEVAGKVITPVAKVLSHLPGTLGTIGRVVSGVTGAVKTIADQIPNSKAKETVMDYARKVDDTSQKVIGKIGEGGERAQDFMRKVATGIDLVKKVPGQMKDEFVKRVTSAAPAPSNNM